MDGIVARRLIQHGMSFADAHAVEDVALHACGEAQKTLIRIIETLPDDRLQLHAMVVAVAALAVAIDHMKAELQGLASKQATGEHH